ncbi:MAG: hypothetical protein ACRC1K_22845 [Planctomycetia bacterium]
MAGLLSLFVRRQEGLQVDEALRHRIAWVRSSLAETPRGALVGWVGQPRSAVPDDIAVLTPVAEFLRVADGVHAGDFILFGADHLAGPGPHEWLPGGAGRWLTVGRNHAFWLALDRGTGEVSELDADGATEVIRELGPYSELVRGLFGADYLRLSYGLSGDWAALVRQSPPG